MPFDTFCFWCNLPKTHRNFHSAMVPEIPKILHYPQALRHPVLFCSGNWHFSHPSTSKSNDPCAMGQVTLTENFPDRTIRWGTQTVAKISRPPIDENMIRSNSHAHAQNRINLHNTLYLPEINTLFRVYPRLIKHPPTLFNLSHLLEGHIPWFSWTTFSIRSGKSSSVW